MSKLTIEYNGATLTLEGIAAKGIWHLVSQGVTNLDELQAKVKAKAEVKEKRTYAKRNGKHHTAKLWTQEEYDKLTQRSDQLKAGGVKMRSKRVEILSKEFTDRTPLAILARLQEYEQGKPFHVKPHWRKHEPEPEPTNRIVPKEYLTANPHGEIDL